MGLYGFDSMRDKVCVLTGGGVIGTSMAQALASTGVKLAILDLNPENAKKAAATVTQQGATALAVQANVLERSSLESAKQQINKELGPIDYLINGAGGNSPKATTQAEIIAKDEVCELGKTFFGLDIDAFDWVFDLNFKGTVLPTMVFGSDMLTRAGGAIVNISSMNSFRPLTRIPAYSAAKAAVNNLTQWLAIHFAKCNVRVNAIAPGFFLTAQNRFLLTSESDGSLTPRGQKIITNTPMGRFGVVEELNGTLLYLLSDMAAFITGVVIPVDGGFSAYSGV